MDSSDVILGDCLELMSALPQSFFDLILTDPPYDISRPNNFSTMGREGFNWDWDEHFDVCGWLPLALPLLKPGGSLVIFTDWKKLGVLASALLALECLIKDPIVLSKKNPHPRNVNRRYVSGMEFALWAVKPGEKWTFNKDEDVPYQRSLFSCAVSRGQPGEYRHPAAKPLELFQRLIEIHTDPGGWVLDPFAGGGTSGVAAESTGRFSLQIEKNPEHFDAALSALREALSV